MIIVGQKKDVVLNYNMTLDVHIDDMHTGRRLFATSGRAQYLLGEYATPERAYEVLRQIENAYVNWELVKIPKMSFQEDVTSEQLAKCICFEMPEE